MQLGINPVYLDLGIYVHRTMSGVKFIDLVPYVVYWTIAKPVQAIEFTLLFVTQVFKSLVFRIGAVAVPESLPGSVKITLLNFDGSVR